MIPTIAIVLGLIAHEADPPIRGELVPGQPTTAEIAATGRDRLVQVVVELDRPGNLPSGVPIAATVRVGETRLSKSLHLGDPDVTWTLRQPARTPLFVDLDAPQTLGDRRRHTYAVSVADLGDEADGVRFEVEPNDSPAAANPVTPGISLYGSADDRPYLPLGATPTEAEQTAGKDWFRLDWNAKAPQLAYIGIEFVDRDIPPDVRVYTLKGDEPVEYLAGIDPQAEQRERPPRPGANKFTTRVLQPGETYYLMVDACQPDYQLRVKLLDPPPYLAADATDPDQIAAAARRAVRAASDFQLLAGDSWHANTPRKGHATERVGNVHHETSTCIACHPTQFTTQSVLSAARDGYKVEEPWALAFLTERLANNPVPLHGHEGAVWARMIPAPANVLGRMSTILMEYEDLITGQPRAELHKEIAEFLELYYRDRDAIPPNETNGNNPISRYKVAADARRQLDRMHVRTGDPAYAALRDRVEGLLASGAPDTVRDLAAQTIGWCQADPTRHRKAIDANVARLLELQRPDGHWSTAFDPTSRHATMQTGESLYALALAGLTPDHPAVKKGVIALLREQAPFGGWFDLSTYEQFRTPFRETQWSLMALARLYPGDWRGKGWSAPIGPVPDRLDESSPARLIRDLERIWDPPTVEARAGIVRALGHPAPMVRLAAAMTLARVGEAQEVDELAARLGEESKLVQRAVAEALRRIANRLHADARPSEGQTIISAALSKALAAPDDRTRRGATRVFGYQFRELARDHALADALLMRLDDSDPVARMQAIKGLWRWWYWRDELPLREQIENRLLAQLDRDEDPWVRRNLIDALYIIGDENIRYLYNNWVPSLASEADRGAVERAQHATMDRLGDKYVKALREGSRNRRLGVLAALSEFSERPPTGGRVGNDVEPLLFYGESRARMAAALAATAADPDPEVRRLALQGLVAVRGEPIAEVARAVLARRGDESEEVRRWAAIQAKDFAPTGPVDADWQTVLDALLAGDRAEGRAAAWDAIGRLGEAALGDRSRLLAAALADPEASVRRAAWGVVHAIKDLSRSADVKAKLPEALADAAPEVRAAALRLIIDRRASVPERELRRVLEDPAPPHRLATLDLIQSEPRYAEDLRLVGVVAASLAEEDGSVRDRALGLLQARPQMVNNPAVEDALRELARVGNARQAKIGTALLASRGRDSGAGTGDVLDIGFFRERVMPIFRTPGEDGETCLGCHRSHAILRLYAPDQPDGTWSDRGVRSNYRSALRVVDLAQPAQSLLLGKPTWEAAEEAEAQNDPTKKAHAGGVRFESGTSDEYQVILDWINGATLAGERDR